MSAMFVIKNERLKEAVKELEKTAKQIPFTNVYTLTLPTEYAAKDLSEGLTEFKVKGLKEAIEALEGFFENALDQTRILKDSAKDLQEGRIELNVVGLPEAIKILESHFATAYAVILTAGEAVKELQGVLKVKSYDA